MSKQAGISIQTKVNLSLLVVFVLIFISSLTTIFRSETGLVREVAKTTARNTADSYFDSINILMLSGAMGNRQALQQKILSNPDLTEARIIRGKAVSDTYGPGLADAGIQDEYDRRALRGEEIVEELDDEQGHRLIVVTPMHAQQNYKGTNCLTCHQVAEGTVLGAVRVTYSFTSLDQQIGANLARVAALELGLFVAGILVIGLLLRRLVVKPIQALSQTIGEIERGSDLSLRAPVGSPDEIGQMSVAFNGMLQTLHDSLQQVSRTARMLGSSSHQIGEIAELANRAVHLQQSQTGSVAAAMAQMEVATRSVEASAGNTVSASDQALKESRDGTRITDDAIAAIEQLQQNIGNATGVIVQLDEQSEKVGQVLDVIQRIAEQTNLLALNAAIEAARAGEQGRGFAVVADEVRTLATRTRHSTDEIQVIIQQLQQDAKDAVNAMQASLDSAGNGVQQVRQTADALGRIATEVQAINRMNHEVAASVREQTQMAGSVEQSVGDISHAAEQTASRADQLSRVAGELNSHAGQLSTMLKRFRL